MGFENDFAEIIGNALENFIYTLFYPIIAFLNIIFSFIVRIVNSFMDFFNALMGLGNTILNMVTGFMSIFGSNIWTTLIFASVAIVIILRVYYFLKDVEIAGFKI